METNNCPLVSVPVITYNSSKTILETLESIKAQTYQNIELVISDDCSNDNTVEICQEWIEKNKVRFVNTTLLTSPVNTGISANVNRAEAACHGEWVKGIAGDDLLMSDCVEFCVNYVAKRPDINYLFGKVEAFGPDKNRCKIQEQWFDGSFFELPADEQLHSLIYEGNHIPAPTSFFRKSYQIQNQIFNDTRIPNIEDRPKWINLLKKGEHLFFADKILVRYRLGGVSTNEFCSTKYYESKKLMFYYYLYPEMIKDDPDSTIKQVVAEECYYYSRLKKIEESTLFQLYSRLLRLIKRIFQ